MARVPTDTSSLRGMRQGTRVAARPVDTYVSVGNQVQRNSKTQQIANALAQVEPTIANYFDNEFNRLKADQKQEGLKSYLEASPAERKAYAKKIKSGEIDEIESPFFIEGVSRGVLRDKARDFGNSLIQEWNKKKDSSGFNVNDFIANYQDEFIKNNGLEMYDAEVFNQEFAQRAESFGNIVNQRAYEHSLKKAREYQIASLGKDVVAARNESFNQETGQFDTTGYVKKINEVVDDYIAQGLDPAQAIQEAKYQLEALATQDEEDSQVYIDAMKGIKTRVGTLGETGSGALAIAKLEERFENKREAAADKAYQQDIQDRKQELAVLEETALTQLVNEGKEYFETPEGKNLLESIMVNPQGGMETYSKIEGMIANYGLIETDPAVKAAYQTQILAGVDVQEQVRNDPDLSPQDKAILLSSNDVKDRVGNINDKLGFNHVDSFVRGATRPTKDMLGMNTTKYDALAPEFTLMANNIVLEATEKFNQLQSSSDISAANKWIMQELKALEPLRDQRRAEIASQQNVLSNYNMNDTEFTEIEQAPVEKDIKDVLMILPKNIASNDKRLAIEQNRPTTIVTDPIYEPNDTQELDQVEYLEDLETLINEYNRVNSNPDMAWETSAIFRMAMNRGVDVERVLTEVSTKIASQPPTRPVPEGIGPNGETLEELEEIRDRVFQNIDAPKQPPQPSVDDLQFESGQAFDRVQSVWEDFTKYFGGRVDLTMPTQELVNNSSLQTIMQGVGIDLTDPAQAAVVAERIDALREQTGITEEMANEIEAYLEGK